MTHRAIELLNLPSDEPKLLLDIGCGSGLSGEILDELGHYWVGVDVAPSMLGEYYEVIVYIYSDVVLIRCYLERLHWNVKLKVIYS